MAWGKCLAAFFVAGLAISISHSSEARDFIVDSVIDLPARELSSENCEAESGRCTLRAAIQKANLLFDRGETDHRILLGPGEYLLSVEGPGEDGARTGDLDIRSNITITDNDSGTGKDFCVLHCSNAQTINIIIDGNNIDRVFHIVSGKVTIENVIIRNGRIDNAPGGGIYNEDELTLLNVALLRNLSNKGGGLSSSGASSLTKVDIKSNGYLVSHTVHSDKVGGGIHNSGNMAISDAHIEGNFSKFKGGGIANEGPGAELSVTDAVIFSNRVPITDEITLPGLMLNPRGGGVFNSGSMSITGTEIYMNLGKNGGGVWNEGTMELDKVAVYRNKTRDVYPGDSLYRGGGIGNYSSAMPGSVITIKESAIYENRAGVGGGIYNLDGRVRFTNSTVSSNVADSTSAGIYCEDGVLEFSNSTYYRNFVRLGGSTFSNTHSLGAHSCEITIKNSLFVEDRHSTMHLEDTRVNSLDYNYSTRAHFVQDRFGNPLSPHDLGGGVPTGIGPLQNNGGPAPTHALTSGGGVDYIPPGNCTDLDGAPLRTDQRGFTRPIGVGCDIGAYEKLDFNFILSFPPGHFLRRAYGIN